MKIIGDSHISRWLWIYLLLILLTSIATHILVYKEITRNLTLQTKLAGVEMQAPVKITPDKSWADLKLRLFLLMSAAVLCIIILGFLWIRIAMHRIDAPMREIRRALSMLARGKLDETVSIHTSDEIGRIAAGVNELAANLQELLLFIWKQTGQCLYLLERIQNDPNLRQEKQLTIEGIQQLMQLSESLQNLREMVKTYVFYDVSLDGDQTMAINALGRPPKYSELSDN